MRMSRRAILFIVLGVALLGMGGWWFSAHLKKVPVNHYEPPGQAAQDNRYLALERFMSRMGRGITSSGDILLLDKLRPGGVLILDRHHRAALNKERLKEVFDWVGKGGYLIVVPEYSDEPDPVMSYLHVQWDDDDESCDDCGLSPAKGAKPAASHPASAPEAASPHAASAPVPAKRTASSPLTASQPRPAISPLTASAPAAAQPRPALAHARPKHAPASPLTAPRSHPAASPLTASSPPAAAPPQPAPVAGASAASAPAATDDGGDDDESDDDEGDDSEGHAAPKTLSAFIPGSAHPLAIRMQYSGLKPGNIKPSWKVAVDAHSDWLVHYRYGLGNVTLITNLDAIVSNDAIGDFDHAEFFWKLLQHFQPKGPVTLMTHLPIPDLFDWLAGSAWTASISGAVLIALWLWSVAPRFGAAAPDVPPARRELREHLNAIGRFVWRNEGLGRWLETARGAFRERLLIRHPAIAAMAPEHQAEALAQISGLAGQTILTALTATPRHASEFTAILRTLKHLKHNL